MKTQLKKSTLLCITGLFAAMITLMTGFILHIPYGANGGYIHFGDALIFIAASMLPKGYAIAAAIIGAGLADLMTAPMWMPATIIIKFLLVLLFTNQKEQLLTKRNLIAPFIAIPITVIGYYIAEVVLFGSFAAPMLSVPGNLIQAGGSIIIYYFIASALQKAHIPSFKTL